MKLSEFPVGSIVKKSKSWDPRSGPVHRYTDERGVTHTGVALKLINGEEWEGWNGTIVEFPEDTEFEAALPAERIH